MNTLSIKQESYTEGREWMAAATFGNDWGKVGFADVRLKQEDGEWVIEFTSTYHSVVSMQDMYDSNAEGWAKS